MRDLPEELLRPFIEHLPDAVAMCDFDGRYVYANRATERVTQQPATSLLGKVIWEELRGLKELPFREAFQRVASGELTYISVDGESAPGNPRLESALVRIGGRIVAISREPAARQEGEHEAQAAMRRTQFLADASIVLSGSPDRGELL